MTRKKLVLTFLTIAVFLFPNLSLFDVSASPTVALTQSTILFVKPGDAGDCSSWEAACDLQTALALAEAGDQVWVAAGIYKATTGTDRTATFLLESGVAIYGGFPDTGEPNWAQRDWETNLTTLSGDIGTEDDIADNSYHVVTGSAVDKTAILDGFIITAANSNGGSATQKVGGGMYLMNSSPTLLNITFAGNLAAYGGGMSNQSGSPTLTNVVFSDNEATSRGGGMYNLYSSNPTLTNVNFSDNSAVVSNGLGGGMYNYESSSPTLINVNFSGNSAVDGGGMCNSFTSSPTLINVIFSSNTASPVNGWGGGMYNIVNSNPHLTNVSFSNNSAGKNGGGMFNDRSHPTLSHVTFANNTAGNGGGMYNSTSSPTLTNVTFSGNAANGTMPGSGGGMFNSYFDNTLTNVTFYGNTATTNGGAMHNYRTTAIVINAIFWGNAPDQVLNGYFGSATVTHSIIQDGYTGEGNLADDPLLSSLADNGGFTQTHALGAGSPAIDTANSAACPEIDQRGYIRPTGDGCDMGAFEYSSTPATFSLDVSVVEGGSVTQDPDVLEYNWGDVVTLTATPEPGWTFTGWGGDASGSNNPLFISILGDTSVTANFTQDEYTLDVSVDPIDSGSVLVDPIKDFYNYGDTVTLTASPNTGWTLTGWSGDTTGTENPLELTITGNTNITANFTDEYSLVVNVDPADSGTVTVFPEQTVYHYGDEVVLTPTAETGWIFSGWSGDATGTESPLTMTIQGNTSITANFTQIEYTLTVTIDAEDSGSVLIDPIKDFYHYGDQVTLTATADPSWIFMGWGGYASGSDNPLTITIQGDTSITALFKTNWIFLPMITR